MKRSFTKYPSSYILSATATRTPQQAKIHKLAMLINGYVMMYDLDLENPKDMSLVKKYIKSRGYDVNDDEFADIMNYYNSWLM